MKSQMLIVVAWILMGMTLSPLRCQAQAEIAPDHYNSTGIEPVTLHGNDSQATQKTENLQGTFTLPFDVNYEGLTLSAGRYSLSALALGKWDLVTLVRQGNRAPIQIRMKSRLESDRPTAVVLRHTGQQRTLTAISWKEPRVVLYLEPEQARGDLNGDTELVPISYPTGKAAAK